jgi:hypothetical protein
MRSLAVLSYLSSAGLLLGCASPDGGEAEGSTRAAEAEATSAATCVAQPTCDGAGGPDVGPRRSWEHTLSTLISLAGSANHRGRDQIAIEGGAQWVIGKFSYGLSDKDLKDEEIDIYVERGCGGSWEKLGTSRTTKDGEHPEVEGVPDTGGRVYFQIPPGRALAPGRHRVRLVVAGDHSSADLLIDVVPKGAQLVVSDVDGTLTSSEHAEWPALLTGSLPGAHPKAAEALGALVARGYRPVYLTARPEWLTGRTREFLKVHGFPPGIVHTTTGLTGALGGAAVDFKSRELALFGGKGLKVAWALGNKDSDAAAYDAARIEPRDQRVFLKIDDPNGGRRIESYGDLLPAVNAAPRACKAP